jgi:hypothetical protein
MLVDENGHGKGLPLNRRDCQERRTTYSVDDLVTILPHLAMWQ